MESFKLWLEERPDVRFIGDESYAGQSWVKFSINGKRYKYQVDPSFLQGRTRLSKRFFATKDKAPLIALNVAKEEDKKFNIPKPVLEPIPMPKQQTQFDF
jgi:hypothetical protein